MSFDDAYGETMSQSLRSCEPTQRPRVEMRPTAGRGWFAVTVCLALFARGLWAQEVQPPAGAPGTQAEAQAGGGGSVFELTVVPEGQLPVGTYSDSFSLGGGGSVSGHLRSRELPWVVPTVEASYSFAPVRADIDLSLVRLTAGAEIALRPMPRFAAYAFGTGGGFYGFLTGSTAASAFGLAYRAGIGASFRLTPVLGISAGVAYSSHLGLHDGVSAFIGTRLTFGDSSGFQQGPRIRIYEPEFDTMFPVLFKYYDTNPLGTVKVENSSDEPLTDVEIRVEVPQFMDTPKVSARIAELAPGETREVELTALFTDEVLTLTEGTKVTANVVATHAGAEEPVSSTATLSTYDRNALRWDDDAKIAAFVTARDDEIQSFAKNVASLSRPLQINGVSRELQLGMAQHAALVEHGTSYVIDPSSAYEELSQNPLAVDYVQFPRQTLQFRAGDCDDLSATYSALLESVGVDTAFITTPGHIYTAFKLNMPAQEARHAFSNPDDLIVRDDGTVWVPVETTVLQEGFNEAWATGARQWREHNPAGNAGFVRTGEAWGTYQPVAFSVSDIRVAAPEQDEVAEAFRSELDRFIERELYGQAQRYVRRLESDPRDARTRNRLGVLYARYGQHDRARAEFEIILDQRRYVPALVNLGNLAFVENDYGGAKRFFERALALDADNPTALLGVTRAASRLKQFDAADETYERLASVDAELAERFSHLDPAQADGAARASGAEDLDRVIVWEEE